MSRETLLSAIFEQSKTVDLVTGAAPAAVQGAMDEPGRLLDAALRAHEEQSTAANRGRLRRSCLDYGATAIAAADALMAGGRLPA